MNKAFALLFIFAISLQGFSTALQKDGEEKLSPFVGRWNWAWNDNVHQSSGAEKGTTLCYSQLEAHSSVTTELTCPNMAKMEFSQQEQEYMYKGE